MNDLHYLAALPGAPEERKWIKERLETLSVRESYALAAATARHPPENTGEAVRCLHSLDDYEICFPTGNLEQLGALYLCQYGHIPEDALPYADMEKIGQMYQEERPGSFVGQCYVVYPKQPAVPGSQEPKRPPLRDDGWSVKLKLASPACPEGVWLRLPCLDGEMPGESVEIALALHELNAKSLEGCTLLEAQCIFPEMDDLMGQYDSIPELVRDGDYFGYVLDEQGQGEAYWKEKFAAAMEYEGCHTLRTALDISQNLHCYEWISCGGLTDFAANRLREDGVSDKLIHSGCIDLDSYARDLLETSGYLLTKDGSAYVTRNGREFIREFTSEQASSAENGMTMQ